MKILMAGGGTLGSVTPLLAVVEELVVGQPGVEIRWIGTNFGPEQKIVEEYHLKFKPIICGRWRWYFSLLNILDIFKIIVGFFQSLTYLISFRPQALVTAGAYVAVPVAWAAWLFHIPVFVHQQDLRLGLANKLILPLAKTVTAAWQEIADLLVGRDVHVIGNPVRRAFTKSVDRVGELKRFGWSTGKPIILVMGGGTGSEFINKLLIKSLPALLHFCNVIHITGDNKSAANAQEYYKTFSLAISNLPTILHLSNLVVARAGMGTISELSALGKPSIIIPMPQSHQEANAQFLNKYNAAQILNQDQLDAIKFVKTIGDLLSDETRLRYLSSQIAKLMPKNAALKLADIIIKQVK